VILGIAKEIRETATGALLVNFTNPSGLVTEALNRYAPDVQSVGVCNAPYNAKISFLELLQNNSPKPIDPARMELKTLGLNHLTWHYGLTLDGEDVWSQVLEAYLQDAAQQEHPEWETALIANTRMIPNYYLQYFYQTEKKLAEQKKYPPSRAEEVMNVEAELLLQYADPSLTEPPADLMKRGGAYYSTVATQLLVSHFNDLSETHVVNVRNDGAVKEWDSNWVLELPAIVRRSGITPIPAAPLPPFAFGLLAAVKSYEILTAQAAVTGDSNAAYQALIAHPLGPKLKNAQKVLDDMLETNRAHLPQFFK
jgi:6-phospho-beta-glucosidase